MKASSKVVGAQGLVNRREQCKVIKSSDKALIEDGIESIDSSVLSFLVENNKIEIITDFDIETINWVKKQSDKHTRWVERNSTKENQTKKTYLIKGFAPGNYQCKCVTCEERFVGDKRVVQCESCAEKDNSN